MSAITRHLVRLSRSVPLPTLKQGGTLSVRSSFPNVAVRIQPEWRDDGQATLFQENLGSGGPRRVPEATMIVSKEEDMITSLGRSESHVSIQLETKTEATSVESIISQTSKDATDSGQGPLEFQEGDALVSAWLSSEGEDANTTDTYESKEDSVLTLTVPEKVNIVCELEQGGSIEVSRKIEGDVRLMTTEGDIRVKKLRGHTVDLETKSPRSTIYASDLLEAYNLKVNLLHGGRLRAKRIHGDTVDIRVAAPDNHPKGVPSASSNALDEDDEGSVIDVSSMYVSGVGGAEVSISSGLRPAKRAVRIKSHHGPVLVEVNGAHKPTMKNATPAKDSESAPEGHVYPMVELGSVNGSCEVSIRNVISDGKDDDWVSCQVHYDSVSPESVSLIHTDTGNVSLTLDRKLEADLRLLSSKDTKSLEETAGTLADEDDVDKLKTALSKLQEAPESSPGSKASRINIDTNAYTESERFISLNDVVEYVEGFVENKSHEPDSRFEIKTRGDVRPAAGKISHDSAAGQALERFSSPEKVGGSGVHDKAARPLVVAATTGTITVETLSWLGAIARRYGLDEEGKSLGRQATRRGRPVLPADE